MQDLQREIAPEINLESNIEYLKPEIYYTQARIPIYLMRNHHSEAAKMDFIFDAGTIYNSGPVAGLTTGLLLAGTPDNNLIAINDALDNLGGYFNASVASDHAYLSIFGLNESMPEITALIENSVSNAAFPEEEVNLLKQERRQQLRVALEKVGTLAQRAFHAALFKNTPYGKLNQPEDYDTITRQDIIAFHQAYFLKGLIKINWVGNPTSQQIQTVIQSFDQWEPSQIKKQSFQFELEKKPIHIEKSGAVQSSFRIGKILFDRTHPDYHTMTVLNTILGDYFGSRLMSNIREDKGYTYGIGSYLGENASNGYFMIGTEVGNEFREDTQVQIKMEIDRLQNELVPEEELDLVRNYLVGQFLRGADGPFSMMELFSVAEMKNLDYSFYQEAMKTILTIDSQAIQNCAKKHLKFEEMLVVTAG